LGLVLNLSQVLGSNGCCDPSIRSAAIILLAEIAEAIGGSLRGASTFVPGIVDIISIEEAT